MSSALECYTELLALTQMYLLQEYSPTERIFSDPEIFEYFKATAQRQATPVSPEALPTEKGTLHLQSRQPTSPAQPPATPTIPEQKPHLAPVEKRTPKIPDVTHQKDVSQEKVTSQHILTFALETLPPLKPWDLTEIRKLTTERLPHISIVDAIPSFEDSNIPEVIIFAFDTIPEHLTLLNNIANALNVRGVATQVIDAQKSDWNGILHSPKVRLVLAEEKGILANENLRKSYRKNNEGANISEHPLLLLSDVASYLREPALKVTLWKALKEILKIS